MLHLLDESLESFLRAVVPLDAREIDVAFAAPDKNWGARVTRPTINLFLFDIHPNAARAVGGVEHLQRNGKDVRRRPPPRIDFSYLVTAWTTEPRDEHQLLGAVLRAVLASGHLPEEHLKGALTGVYPLPDLALAPRDTRTSAELWSALEGQLKAGLEISVTLAVDTDLFEELERPPEEIEVAVSDRGHPDRRTRRAVRPTSAVEE